MNNGRGTKPRAVGSIAKWHVALDSWRAATLGQTTSVARVCGEVETKQFSYCQEKKKNKEN